MGDARLLRVYVALLVGLPLAVAGLTGHAWEDFFITFRFSENLAEGRGLVFGPGQRVHGFTSPLGVLLPAACHIATGSTSWLAALWAFRLLCVAAFAGGGLLLVAAARRAGASPFAQRALALGYLLEAKSVTFAISGMETAFVLLFLALGLWAVVGELGRRREARALAVAWAGLQWTRPDGCILALGLALAALILTPGSRRETLGRLVRAALHAALLYGPWLVIATALFASPIPHTVRAKALSAGSGSALAVAFQAFSPAYVLFSAAAGSYALALASTALLVGGVAAAAVPAAGRLARAAAVVALVDAAYLSRVCCFPWYLPPLAVAALAGLAGLADAGARRPGPVGRMTRGLTVTVLLGLAAQLAVVSRQLEVQRRLIEDGVRAPLGRWLRHRIHPDERVLLEPLGWVGYFSQAPTLDLGGLVSPEVVAYRRRGAQLDGLVAGLCPEWLVLRPMELDRLAPATRARYAVVAELDARPQVLATPGVVVREWLLFDARFLVLRLR